MPSDSGKRLELLHPTPDQICLGDIATGLSLECRFGNQLPTHYSVAQHSVLVAKMMERDELPERIQAAGLMHDASEAYLGDLPGPLKVLPEFAFYRNLEAAWQATILAKYGLYGGAVKYADRIRKYDRWALYLEAHAMKKRISEWESLQGVEVPIHHEFEHPVGHEYARVAFLRECERLGIKD